MAHTKESRARSYEKMKQARKEFLLNKSCVLCGSVESLEVDHVDPKTKTGHTVWSWKASRRDEELRKCQVLCKLCHREKTRLDISIIRTKPIKHGTSHAYGRRGCRCETCKSAYSAARQAHYKRTGN